MAIQPSLENRVSKLEEEIHGLRQALENNQPVPTKPIATEPITAIPIAPSLKSSGHKWTFEHGSEW